MKKKAVVILAIFSFVFGSLMRSQNPTKAFEIESILVDACNATSLEPNNEMFVFKVGSNPINTASLSISGQNGVGTYTVNSWPTPGISWNGVVQNAATATVTAALQATITNGCGVLLEPPGGILPRYASVLMVTSSTPSTTDNSFATLTDTLYIIYHNDTYTTSNGHFKNSACIGSALSTTPCTYTASANRGFVLTDNASGVSDTVHYDITLLKNTVPATPYGGSTSQNDGATVEYAWPGFPTPSYINNGCKAPFIPLSASATPTNTTICSNASASLTGTAGGTYTSTAWSGGTGTFGNPNALATTYTPGPGETGTVILTLTVYGKCAGATATSTVSVTVNPLPMPSISSSNGASICSGTSTTLSVTSTGTLSTTYTWNPGGMNTSTLSVTPSVGVNIYTVTAANSCGSLSASYTVNVNALPTITVSKDSICPGGNGSLTASGASTYTWSSGTQGAVLTANPSVTTQYTVSGTNVNGCVNTATEEIFVNPTPTVTVNNPSICPGTSCTLTANGAATYTWSTSQTGNSISVSPSGTTSYTVIGESNKGCIQSAIVLVTVFNQPVVSVNSVTTCPSASNTLTASGANTYTWSNSQTGPSITVNPGSSTSYTVTGTDANGCVGSNVANVTVVNSLTVTAAPASASICNGSSTTITGVGAASYTWSPVGSLSASTGTTVTASPSINTTYTVIGVSGGCSDTTTVTVNVNNLPSVTASASSPAVCSGGTVTLNGGGANTYTWTGGVTNGAPFTPSSTQAYTVTGTDNNGCTSSASVLVTVYPTPNISVNSSGVCPGGSVSLTASGGTAYVWSSGQTTASISVSPLTTTSYTVIGTDAFGCTNLAVATVTINPLPTVSATSATTCAGSATNITASGAVTYTWSTSQTGATVSVPGQNATFTVTGTDANGCINTATASVSTMPLPAPQTVMGNTVICAGASTSLSVTPGAYTYNWSGPGVSGNGTSVTATQAGVYTLTTSNACGSVTSQFTVTVSSPQAAFTPTLSTGTAPATFTFVNNSTATQPGYSWSMGNGTLLTSTNAAATYTASGTYSVTLVVTDIYGCQNTVTYDVIVTDSVAPIIIPNVFSPNGDNINEVFMVKGGPVNSFNCKIYDRWGLFLSEWNDINGGWDGKNVSNGKEVSDGTYYYIISYVDKSNKAIVKNGYLQLIR